MAGTPAPWETWTSLFLAGLQLAVAYWWWKGPHLPGTRGWVTALFGLNGAATLLNHGSKVLSSPLLDSLGTLADRPTNVALLALGVIALDPEGRRRRWWGPALLVLLAVQVPSVVLIEQAKLAGTAIPDMLKFATTPLLLLAAAVGGVALLQRGLRWSTDEDVLWGLALAGVVVRYADLSVLLFKVQRATQLLDQAPHETVRDALYLLALAALVLATAGLLVRYLRDPPDRNRRAYELVLALLVAGFLYGVARNLSTTTFLGVVFTMALVRPLIFLEVRARLDGDHLWSGDLRRTLATGTCAFLTSLAGVGVAAAVGLGTTGALLTAAGLLPLGVLAGVYVQEHGPPPLSPAPPAPEQEGGGWPVDREDVTLPPDWRERLAAGQRAYRDLDPEVRERLDALSHWERILLALEGAPEGGDLPPYERTTPGLHLRTHCPYASIGPEIRRANARARTVAEDLGLDPGPGSSSRTLVEEGWGRAQGLESPRVKHYDLTPLGRRVAEAIRDEVGLGDADPDEVARVVADGFEAPD